MSKIGTVEQAQELIDEMRALKRVPDRILINENEAVPLRRALSDYHTTPDILFIRDDGWILGAPSEYEQQAYAMWNDSWIAYLRRPSYTVEDIKNYRVE